MPCNHASQINTSSAHTLPHNLTLFNVQHVAHAVDTPCDDAGDINAVLGEVLHVTSLACETVNTTGGYNSPAKLQMRRVGAEDGVGWSVPATKPASPALDLKHFILPGTFPVISLLLNSSRPTLPLHNTCLPLQVVNARYNTGVTCPVPNTLDNLLLPPLLTGGQCPLQHRDRKSVV